VEGYDSGWQAPSPLDLAFVIDRNASPTRTEAFPPPRQIEGGSLLFLFLRVFLEEETGLSFPRK